MKKTKTRNKKPTAKQALFINLYTDPKSATFGNARQSALKAGYSKNYANRITVDNQQAIMAIACKAERMIMQAECNLMKFLETTSDEAIDKKIKADVTKFVLERLDKKKWSQRTEITGDGGNPITGFVVEIRNDKNNQA